MGKMDGVIEVVLKPLNLAAAMQRLYPKAHVGARAAAYLRGYTLDVEPGIPEFTLPAKAQTVRRKGISVRRSGLHSADELYGIKVQSIAYVILEVARTLGGDDLVVFLDSVLGH